MFRFKIKTIVEEENERRKNYNEMLTNAFLIKRKQNFQERKKQ